MRDVDKILLQLEEHIKSSTYSNIETERFELKDFSTGDDWKELYKSVCAFLNSQGGIIVIGVKEDLKNKKFVFTGFNGNNEPKVKEICKQFTSENETPLDLAPYIRPDLIELKPFLDGQVAIVFVEKLPDDEKYVFYKKEAYERRMTGDHKITADQIQKQKELVNDLKYATELNFVPNTSLDDLDVEKLNDYIIRLNNGLKVETLKADINSSQSFLNRKKMIRDGKPTLLGMLVCGKNIFDFVGGRSEVDAYFETGNNLADDQKILKDNIISLMDNAISYAFSKTGTGVSVHKGGTTVFEYPEEVLRETINNALAHRDYKSDRFIIIRIANNQFIEIRNPGKFRQEQLVYADEPIKLRRIIPIPKAQNPNLADILKTYKRWEGRGIGMASLTNYALNNSIDVPYYRIYNENEIGLYIPKGEVLDEKTKTWLTSFDKFIKQKTDGIELSTEQATVLAYFYKSELLNRVEKYTVNLTPDNNHFVVIQDLEKWDLIYKLPQSNAISQMYGINPTFRKSEFSKELRAIFGGSYDALTKETKEVLETIYQFNQFISENNVSASEVSNYIIFKKSNSKIDSDKIKDLENFKRKVRSIVNKLEKNGFIKRKAEAKPNYEINTAFERSNSIFDS